MEQESTLYRFKDGAKLTAEMVLKLLAFIIDYGAEKVKNFQDNRHFSAKTSWNKFMASSNNKEVKTFLASEVNLRQLQAYLKEYKIGFSFRETQDGKVMLAFETKNESMVREAFERVLKDMGDPEKAEKLSQKLLNNPKNMDLQASIKHYKAKEQAQIKAKIKATAPKAVVKSVEQEIAK